MSICRPLDRTESDASAERINEDLVQYGFGLWAVEVIGVADFIGFTGLALPGFTAHFTPCVEIGWRIARDYWGFGFATEAARAARDYGFSQMGLERIVPFTVPANQRSRNVMGRIGMTHSPDDDFEHPFCQTVILFATRPFPAHSVRSESSQPGG